MNPHPQPQALPEETPDQPGLEYVELKRLIHWSLWSLALLIGLTLVVQALGGSLTVVAVLIDASTSILLHIFNAAIIGIILRQTPFSHPYGTGKLENFAGFLYAMLAIPGGIWILFSAYGSYIHPAPTANLGLATVAILASVLRSVWLLRVVQRMVRRYAHPSPLTQSYLVNMQVSSVTDLTLLVGVLMGFGVSLTRHASLATYFDVAIASLQGVYLLHCAVQVLLTNFKSLIDLPLPEADQFKILQALTAHFEAYEDIGHVYTQLSGSTRLVQIELYVTPDTTAEALQTLSASLEQSLKAHFGKLVFHLIPLVKASALPSVKGHKEERT